MGSGKGARSGLLLALGCLLLAAGAYPVYRGIAHALRSRAAPAGEGRVRDTENEHDSDEAKQGSGGREADTAAIRIPAAAQRTAGIRAEAVGRRSMPALLAVTGEIEPS